MVKFSLMKLKNKILVLVLVLLGIVIIPSKSFAQNKVRKWSLDGYISYMNTNSFDSISNTWIIDNQIHNRLNFEWFPADNFSFVAQMRNRFMYGNSVLLYPNYADIIAADNGYLGMNWNLLDEKNFLLNVNIDRLYLKYSIGKMDIQIGRQRINWGRTLVWNPNDVFNTYSYFDFDYQEKPGSDAVRVQYYTSASSNLEVAASVNSKNKGTVAAKWLVNKWNYDFQFLAGEITQQDYVFGLGWAGAIKSVAFRGESSYFQPIDNADTSREASFNATFSLDYTFQNSLNIMAQVLYTQIPKDNPISSFAGFYTSDLSAKYLSFTEWNIFGSAAYPITPLINATIAGMYYPKVGGYFVSPSIDYSMGDNLTFSFVYQYFVGEFPNVITGISQKQQFQFAFLRLKMNF